MSVHSPTDALPAELVDVAKLDSERRIATRKVVNMRAKVQLPGGTVLTGHSADISQTGIGLYAPRMLQIEEECTLHIDLSACGMETELKLVGRVCYCTEQGESKFRVGMRFVSLDSNTVSLLNQLLL
jgi:PilZ domain